MIRILYFYSHPFNPANGGIEKVTDTIARNLLSRGEYEVFYLCGHPFPRDYVQYDSPVTQYCLPTGDMFQSDENIKFFTSFVRQKKIDVVISQSGSWSYMNPMLSTGICKYISVIHTIPSMDLMDFNYNYFKHNNTIWGYMKFLLKIFLYPSYGVYKKNRIAKRMRLHYYELISGSDRVVLLSKNYVRQLNSIIGYSSSKIKYINNPNPYLDCSIDYNKKEKVILYVGRLDSMQKQPLELLKIWRKIWRKNVDWKLVIVGDGEGRNEMQKYVTRYKIERVHFEGAKDSPEDYYKIASIICLVSRYEGQPMVLIEGMSRGCIPICYNSFSAIYDVIDDGVNGYIVPNKNHKIYAEKLHQLMNDPIHRYKMTIAAYEKAMQFSQDNIVNRWVNLIESVLA